MGHHKMGKMPKAEYDLCDSLAVKPAQLVIEERDTVYG